MADLDRDGCSELHRAVVDGEAAMVRSLIEQGLDVNLADRGGFTPLHFAAQERHAEIARLIANYDVAQFFEDVPESG